MALINRIEHSRYYITTAKLEDEKNAFDQSIKNDKRSYDNIRKIATAQGDDYTAGCLLDYNYFKKHVNDRSNNKFHVATST